MIACIHVPYTKQQDSCACEIAGISLVLRVIHLPSAVARIDLLCPRLHTASRLPVRFRNAPDFNPVALASLANTDRCLAIGKGSPYRRVPVANKFR